MDNSGHEQNGPERPEERVEEPVAAAESGEDEPVENLTERLGYVESSEMAAIRARWVEAARAGQPEEAREHAIAYQEKAEAADARHLEAFRKGRDLVFGWLAEGCPAEREEEVLGQASELGFVETSDMRAVRARMALARSQGSEDTEPADDLGDYERYAHQLEAHYGAEFQTGLLIAKATVYRDAGQLDYYREDLADAVDYAHGLGLDQIAERLARELGES